MSGGPFVPTLLLSEIKTPVPSRAVLKLMSGKLFMLHVPKPLAAPHGALLVRFLAGSTLKSEVVSTPAAQVDRKCLDKDPVPGGYRADLIKTPPYFSSSDDDLSSTSYLVIVPAWTSWSSWLK